MQRWIITSALGLAAAALAVTIMRAPPQEAQAKPVLPDVDVADPEPLPVTALQLEDGMASRASMDRTAHAIGSSQERFLVVEVQAPEAAVSDRPPLHLAVVMDRSGSMEGESMDNAKRAAISMVQRLNPADSFSMVGFSDTADTVIPRQAVWDEELLAATIQGVRAGGYTNLHAGLEQGIAQLASKPGGNRRVVLLSDGLTNRGVTDPEAIATLAARATQAGVTVSVLGLGVDFDGDLLYAVSDAGGGSYLYAGRSTELVERFEAELDRAFTVAAHDTRVDVNLADGVEVLEVYGYEDWDGKATADGFEAFLGDLSAQETRKVVIRARVPSEHSEQLQVATVEISWQDPQTGERLTHQHLVTLDVTDDVAQLRSSRVPWATVQASTAEVGRHMQWASEAWDRGERDQAQQVLERGSQRLVQLTRGLDDPRIAQLDGRMDKQKSSYRTTVRDSWEGADLHISEGLRALGYLN